jgi:hypothetical protein
VDRVWGEAQPPMPCRPLRVHPLEWAGESVADKLGRVREAMGKAKVGCAWQYVLLEHIVRMHPLAVSAAMRMSCGGVGESMANKLGRMREATSTAKMSYEWHCLPVLSCNVLQCTCMRMLLN